MASIYTSFPALRRAQSSPSEKSNDRKELNLKIDTAAAAFVDNAPQEFVSLAHSASHSLPPSIAARVASREPHWKSKAASLEVKKVQNTSTTTSLPFNDATTVPPWLQMTPLPPVGSPPAIKPTSTQANNTTRREEQTKFSWHASTEWLELTAWLQRYANGASKGDRRLHMETIHRLDDIADDNGPEYLILAWKWATDDNAVFAAQLAYHQVKEASKRDPSVANRIKRSDAKWGRRQALLNRSFARVDKLACTEEVLDFARSMVGPWLRSDDESMKLVYMRDLIRVLLEAIEKRAEWLSWEDLDVWCGEVILWLQDGKWFGEPDVELGISSESTETGLDKSLA
ncbi:hypothetical protein NA57DRAFT_70597 [Rhizodiscina lignyota]|uniref:Uncharacterized protein n=1 Tax=Rhizodiscina lignyota TaxID=1504668 RepID=A0A9P4IMR7_9PEZI|nr:hypothetical protein NA57DRAFT_70597 [Rhizodiscina lignyota]